MQAVQCARYPQAALTRLTFSNFLNPSFRVAREFHDVSQLIAAECESDVINSPHILEATSKTTFKKSPSLRATQP